MKIISPFSALVLLITLVQSTSYALTFGGVGDGGGQGVVCRNDDGSVKSARVLDLVEAEDYFLLQLKDQPKDRPYLDIAREYAAVLDQAMPSTGPTGRLESRTGNDPVVVKYDINPFILESKRQGDSFLADDVVIIDKNKMLIPGDDLKISPIGDSLPRVIPAGRECSLEQIAKYSDGTRQIHFVSGVWNHLDNLNKAALLVHEALYRNLRTNGETTSDRTRKAVGYLFSGMDFTWVLDRLPQKYLFCWTTDAAFQFAVYPDQGSGAIAQFLVYNGEIMLTKTVAQVDMKPFANQFGRPTDNSSWGGSSNRIANPLLDMPYYDLREDVDRVTGVMTASLEAYALRSGERLKPIACQSQLSAITYGADGSVVVGPAPR